MNHEIKYPEVEQQLPEIPDLSYKNTILNEMAEDIKSSQRETDHRIEEFRSEIRDSGRSTFRVAVAALVVSSLTLIATVLLGLLR